jgi:sulfonate transport system substrate-binding protein
VKTTAVWAKAHAEEVAKLLSPEVGIAVPLLAEITSHVPWGFEPVTDAVLADQQNIADTFFSLGLIPRKIAVQKAVLTEPPKQTSR